MSIQNKLVGKIEIIKNLPTSDWKKFRLLRLRAFKNEPQAFLTTYKEALARPPQKWQETLKKVLEGKSFLVFARLDEKLVGMIGAWQNEDDKSKNTATIYGVYVDKKIRGKGIAARLMTETLEELKKKKIKKANLSVNEEQIIAYKLYIKLGFKVISEENLKLGDGKMHKELKMEKEL